MIAQVLTKGNIHSGQIDVYHVMSKCYLIWFPHSFGKLSAFVLKIVAV